jgi:hypothetical protein
VEVCLLKNLEARPGIAARLPGRVRTVQSARLQTAPVMTLDPAATRGRVAASSKVVRRGRTGLPAARRRGPQWYITGPLIVS